MDSWALSACYPQSTFYPLSDDPSTQNHRITMTDFRLCLVRRPCSQAGFCHCTHQAISDRSEPTFARLRYSLGGDRPSQTTHHARSREVSLLRLEFKSIKGGISRLAPHKLASMLQSLPPILHIIFLNSMQSYSKGSWGLSV